MSAVEYVAVFAAESSQAPFPFRSLDELFASIEKELPGFGGVFIDASGVVNVYVTLPTDKATVARVLERVLGRSYEEANIRLLQGNYGFGQLLLWKNAITDELLLSQGLGVTMVDIDDESNVISLGLEYLDEGKTQAVVARLEALRIPRDAVNLVETGPIMNDGHTSRYRPLVGGVQIAFQGFLCTLGFVAKSSGKNSAVTAGHCGGQKIKYYQPLATRNDLIGTGKKDPKGPRWSDSLLISISSSVSISLGTIHRDSGGDAVIAEKGDAQLVGETVWKSGRTTHDTSGKITDVCVDTGHSDYGTVFCQNYADYASDSGDSGSPVYKYVGVNVELYGVHWGRFTGGPNVGKRIYSPIQNIENDLGPLQVTP